MISATAEYALRAVVALAEDPQTPRTARELARRAKVPAGYLAKVLQALARGGIVRSRRGAKGGFVIARSPADLTVLEVVDVVDPLRRIDRCPLDLGAHETRLCPLHRSLDDAIAATQRAFRGTTIQSLLDSRGARRALCRVLAPQEGGRPRKKG